MTNLIKSYKIYFKDKSFLVSVILAFLMLAGSMVANFYAAKYATENASSSVTDIILSNVPVVDVDGLFVYGAVVFWIFIGIISFLNIYKMPFIIKSISLFNIIRAVFITLTHIGPFPTHIIVEPIKLLGQFANGGDLFFSGHTGLPFLMALTFWNTKVLRRIFIASSIFFGMVVLLGHVHYSIDVLSAFFITYGINHIALKWFKKDAQRFEGKPDSAPSLF